MERRPPSTFGASDGAMSLPDGMTRKTPRLAPALGPDYLALDGRRFPQLVADAVDVAELFRFFSPDGADDGTWRDLFLRDTTAVLAVIDATDPTAWEAGFAVCERELRLARSRARKLAALGACFAHILSVATTIETWRAGVLGFRTTALSDRIATLLDGLIDESLGEALLRLKNYSEGAGLPGALGEVIHLDCAELLRRWRLGPVVPDGSIFGVPDSRLGRGGAPVFGRSGASPKGGEPAPAWQGDIAKPRRSARSIAERIEAALPALRELHERFIDALQQIKALPERLLADSLAQTDHPPHLALFFAFAQALGSAQTTLNRIPGRLVDFYYREVLAQSPRAAVPDTVALVGTLAPTSPAGPSFIPHGTRFSLGAAPDGSELVFVTRGGTTVSPATLVSLRGLRAERAAIVTSAAPGLPPDVLREVDQVCVIESDLSALLPRKEAVPTPPPARPLFGEIWAGDLREPSGPSAAEPAAVRPSAGPQYASLGLAIATPCLSLSGGERTIALTLRFSRDSMAALLQRLRPLADALGFPVERTLQAFLPSAFSVSLSTAGGWLPVAGFAVELSEALDSDPAFTLRLSLGASQPAIAPLAVDHATINPEPGWPCVQLRINQQPLTLDGTSAPVQIRVLPLLSRLALLSVRVTTQVVALPGLRLSTAEGALADKPPYAIFGSLPSRHSYLDIHHPELFGKKLQRLQLGLQWFDLPASASGFRGHYQAYVLGPEGESLVPRFDNAVFEVRIAVVRPGLWNIAKTSQNRDTYRLFATHRHANLPGGPGGPGGEEHLDPLTRFENIALSPHGDPPEESAEPGAVRIEPSAVRIELVQPALAFGHALYTVNALAAAQAAVAAPRPAGDANQAAPGKASPGSTDKAGRAAAPVNPPWWPRVSEVRLGYEAGDEIPSTLGERDGQVFHLLPFEGCCRLTLDGEQSVSLVPQLAHPAQLLLGFSQLAPPQPLSLLWRLSSQPSGPGGSVRPTPAVAWEVLDGERWLALSAAQILDDATSGLQHSGIVKLHVPDGAVPTGRLLPGAPRWLRVAVDGDAEAFPTLLGVYPNAFLASWDGTSGGGSHLRQPLPAGSNVAGKDKLPAIEKYGQPMPSFGGVPAEDGPALKTRLSERLRHRDRALLAEDYERLVLQRFPSLFAARALPSRGADGRRAPGQVLLIVLPGPNPQSPTDETAPLCTSQQLAQIQAFLAPRMSPHVQLHVRNPSYVRLTVEATVQFGDESSLSRPAREQLASDLRTYLCPWSERAGRAAAAPSPDSRWDGEYTQRPLIAEFIAKRPYVAALLDLQLHTAPSPDGETDLPPFLTSAYGHRIHDLRDRPSPAPKGPKGRTY